ncbi:MAG: recombination mediator RecR [Longimicrobiaceae bacterium]
MSAIDDLAGEFARLPGIGRKTALRLTYHLLKAPVGEARRLSGAVVAVRERVRACGRCGNLSDSDPCEICRSDRRDESVICVVEDAPDLWAIERSGSFRGLYHVLGGRLSPLDGVGPGELNLDSLLKRMNGSGPVQELVLATNPSVEGEATAVYINELVRPLGVRVTRLARGLPVGGDLEYADGVTIAEAFQGRRDL